MKENNRTNTILMALLGCMLIAAYLWFINNTDALNYLKLQIPRAEIIAKAEDSLKASPLSDRELNRDVRLSIDEDLFRFFQHQNRGNESALPAMIGAMVVEWKGKIENEKVEYSLSYDFQGNLRGFEKIFPKQADSTELRGNQAFRAANDFLHSQGVDTTALTITERSGKRENGIQKFDVTFTGPSILSSNLETTYTVSIAGTQIVKYESSLSIDSEKFKYPAFEKTGDTVFQVTTAVIWMVVIIILVVVFLKRLKREEIEFKRALGVGIVMLLFTGVMIGIAAWPEWAGVLLGGVFGGLFVGAASVVVFAVAESLTREVWPEKVALLDLIFQGRFRVRELGRAILIALFISGITLFFLGGVTLLSERLNLSYLNFKNEDLWALSGSLDIIKRFVDIFVGSFFKALVFLAFLSAFVRIRVQRNSVFMTIMTVVLALAGLFLFFLEPFYLSYPAMFPLAFLWVYWVRKYDLVTIFFASFLTFMVADLYQLALLPEGFGGIFSLLAGSILLILLGLGIFLVFGKRAIADFESYVPEYVSRIAERERFLRELEIARRIQTQFLPQEEPQFAGLDIASICKPAMEVGGDYYDFIMEDGKYFSVVVGDVSGKGVSAAFYMTMTKGIIKTLAKRVKAPSKILSELNEVFYENAPRNIFVSALYGIFDMERRTLTFARAGHNPLLVRKNKFSVMELLNPKGIAIGMEKGPLFSRIIEEQSVHVEPGDIFIFYTDGISEAMNTRGEEFGEERLETLLLQNASGSAKDILENIRKSVFDFAGSAPQHDDFTMVVVKVG